MDPVTGAGLESVPIESYDSYANESIGYYPKNKGNDSVLNWIVILIYGLFLSVLLSPTLFDNKLLLRMVKHCDVNAIHNIDHINSTFSISHIKFHRGFIELYLYFTKLTTNRVKETRYNFSGIINGKSNNKSVIQKGIHYPDHPFFPSIARNQTSKLLFFKDRDISYDSLHISFLLEGNFKYFNQVSIEWIYLSSTFYFVFLFILAFWVFLLGFLVFIAVSRFGFICMFQPHHKAVLIILVIVYDLFLISDLFLPIRAILNVSKEFCSIFFLISVLTTVCEMRDPHYVLSIKLICLVSALYGFMHFSFWESTKLSVFILIIYYLRYNAFEQAINHTVYVLFASSSIVFSDIVFSRINQDLYDTINTFIFCQILHSSSAVFITLKWPT